MHCNGRIVVEKIIDITKGCVNVIVVFAFSRMWKESNLC